MDDSRCLCTRIRRGARVMTARYDAALAPAGINVAQFSLLRHLERLGPASIAALARASGHDRSTLARTLRPLVHDGLVCMGTSADRRKRVPQLTRQGHAAIARALPYWAAAQRQVQVALGVDRDRLFDLLDRLDATPA